MDLSTLPPCIWQVGKEGLDLSRRGLVMGIVNVTPDSFSDGGHFADTKAAVQHGLELAREGADILDIGGESTRPGADPVSEEDEQKRVIPVLSALREKTDALLSVDTSKASVARAALAAGADIVNDVSGFQSPEMIDAVKDSSAGLVAMHMQGEPRTMQKAPEYRDVVRDLCSFFEDCIARLEEARIPPERIALDPGFGFGKTLDHNTELARRLGEFGKIGRPVLVGLSRKSMFASLLDDSDMRARTAPTVALTSALREKGAAIFRVHEVRQNREALRMTEAILGLEA